ncbi:RNA-directed DNA polymerase, eukaryota [Tanacetum coccineum]
MAWKVRSDYLPTLLNIARTGTRDSFYYVALVLSSNTFIRLGVHDGVKFMEAWRLQVLLLNNFCMSATFVEVTEADDIHVEGEFYSRLEQRFRKTYPSYNVEEEVILKRSSEHFLVIKADDLNVVVDSAQRKEERWGSIFNVYGARDFNHFITSAGLVEVQLEGYSYTWAHPSTSKMSKLDRFLVSDRFLSLFPHTSAVCLDRHLSDHRPILLQEFNTDYGATPFRLFHS